MKIIESNPYRYLGVFANASVRERVANSARLRAFLQVGRQPDFPLDLKQYLPPVARTSESVAKAEADLTLPNDRVRYAQFWFIKSTPIDEIAFNHLFAGNMVNAVDIWAKKDNVSSLQNRIVCALIKRDFLTAIRCAETLYSQYSKHFVQAVLGGDTTAAADNLAYDFIDTLSDEVGVSAILPYVTDDGWKKHLGDKAVLPLINEIQSAVDEAKATRKQGSVVRLKAGEKLMETTKSALNQLGALLPKSDLQYQMIADKLGLEILQCGIDYFNGSDDDDAPKKATALQNYALSIVVGKMAKDRCQENVDILKKVGREFCVRKELDKLSTYIETLRSRKGGSLSDRFFTGLNIGSINSIASIVDSCIPLLNSVRTKLGVSDKLYIAVSSAVVGSAVNALVGVVNIQQTLCMGDSSKLRPVISESVVLMHKLGRMDMDSKTRNYYNGNNTTLNGIYSRLHPSSSGGCYIATMVYGDYDHPQVLILRNFRDKYLLEKQWGRLFVKLYYKYSPLLVERLKDHRMINNGIRKILDCFINQIKNTDKV